uniref:Fanconi anemia group B protein n=1 Tax=Pogona vitticeps TaxID=103695 RepID=A0A6J0T1D4_9SAUR
MEKKAKSSCDGNVLRKNMLSDKQDRFLSYNGELLIFWMSKGKSSQGDDTEMNKLHVRRMNFNTDRKLFVEISTASFSMSGEGIEIIHCSCASCFRTGILYPAILLKKKKRKNIKYILLFLYNFNQFEVVLHFKLDYELREPIKILAGPTVLWSCEKNIFYISPRTDTILCAPVKFSSIKWAGEIEGEGIVVFGTRAVGLPEQRSGQSVLQSDALVWNSEFISYAVEKEKMLTSASFLPHAYSSVISCMHVFKAESTRNKFRTSVIAVTCKSQLVVFQDGLPKDVHQLPYEQPCSLQIVVVEGSSQLVVVAFASGDVCALWKHNLQVASCWTNVRCVLVDDFAGIGTEQILILPESDTISESLNDFQITDLGKVNYVTKMHSEDDSSFAEELQENRYLTIKALEARLQAGFASLRELQQHLKLKEKVLMESCSALIDMAQGRTHRLPSAMKEGLVSLWDETETVFDNDISTPCASEEQLVEKLWYHVVEDNLVVGVQLKEALDLLLSDVTLSLIMHQKCPSFSPTKCKCNAVTLKKAALVECTSHWQVEPLPKRVKLDCHNGKEHDGGPSQVNAERIKTFTAVTHLSPFLALHRVHCTVLLHAKKKSCNEENLLKNKKLTLLCGNIFLSLAEISRGKYSINLKDFKYTGSMTDLVSLCAVSHKLSLQITSPNCTLNPISTWLQDQMECAPIKEFPDHMICCRSGDLNGTLFKWNLNTPFEAILTVFCRHQTILLQFLHNLIGLLPPTCKIKLLRWGSKKEFAEQLAQALVKEMATLQNPFSSGLQAENMSLDYGENKETNSITAVQRFRETFEEEQKKSKLCINQTMSIALYRGLVLNVLELQLRSDMISGQCCSFF